MWTPEFVMQLTVMVCTVGVLYGGIRADLASLHKRVDGVEEDVEAARERMDNHVDRSNRP